MNHADGRTARAEQKRISRRHSVLDAARRVFADKGYHGAHVSDIIEEAGIARGTFYLYFESKGTIFLELLDSLLDELKEHIVGVNTDVGSPPIELQLVNTVRRLLRAVADNRALTRIILREAVGLDAEVDGRLRQFYSELLRYIREALDNGKAMGIVRDIDTDTAALCILGTIKQFMALVMEDDGKRGADVDKLALVMLDFNLRGVLSR